MGSVTFYCNFDHLRDKWNVCLRPTPVLTKKLFEDENQKSVMNNEISCSPVGLFGNRF